MIDSKQKKALNLFSIIVVGVVIAFSLPRILFGVELSDEAYSVAETYIVSEGALPFVNNWSQMPGWTLLLAPFMKLFTIFSGGTEGLFLYFKILTIIINIITAATVFYLIKDYINNTAVGLLAVLIYVGASGSHYVPAFRGDNLMINLISVGGLLLSFELSKEESRTVRFFISGLLYALAVLAYPTLVAVYVYLLIAIIIITLIKKKPFVLLGAFIIGSVIAAVIVVLYLSINGSFWGIFEGLHYILKDVAYFRIQHAGAEQIPGYLKNMIMWNIKLLVLVSAIAAFILFIGAILAIKNKGFIKANEDFLSISKENVARILIVAFFFALCLGCLYFIKKYLTANSLDIYISALTLQAISIPYLLLFIKKYKKLAFDMMVLIWIPAFIIVIITGISTSTGIGPRHFLLGNTVILLILFFIWSIKDHFSKLWDNKNNGDVLTEILKYFVIISPAVLVMIITFTNIFNAYTFVYTEDSVGLLTSTVESGVYKGLRTTPERASGIIKLQEVLNEYIDSEDTVLAMDNNPFIYPMTKARFCAPCSWDMALYYCGFDDPSILYDYFKVVNQEPTKIVYFNYGFGNALSIDTDYSFNEYVNDKYNLIYENRNLFKWSYCGNYLTSKLLIFERK